MPLRQHGPQSFLFCPWVGWGNHKHLFNLVHTFLQVSSANWWSANGICENHRQLCVNWWTLDWYWLNVPCDYVWPDMKRHKLGFTWVTSNARAKAATAICAAKRDCCCALSWQTDLLRHLFSIFFPDLCRAKGSRFWLGVWGQSSAAVRFCCNCPRPFAVNQAWIINSVLFHVASAAYYMFPMEDMYGQNLCVARGPAGTGNEKLKEWQPWGLQLIICHAWELGPWPNSFSNPKS